MYYPPYNHPPYHQGQYHPNAVYNHFPPARQYPPVDTEILTQSIHEFQILIRQEEILLERLNDTEFARLLMQAAQHGNQSEVDRLIYSIEGLYVPVQTTYTPSGVIFDLESPAASQGANCCTLTMTLKWGN
ncbi:hypothetical protein [Lentibacillus sp. CBA3610]|uniref:hypothetical protein n=1 Tax=Lentibacillus sp. CBA3610 TaxID=2518176 RepID=UPI001595FD79|nr:hypothetical protein [Lentibacillus sp. CBA3610]QKY68410.1 hypothetical protein Len3610_01130 [Lentibacillus sp. CBA3610]